MKLDPASYQAIASLRIESGVKLPKDSSAAIQSTGLIGEKFLAIEPGGDEAMMADGDKIAFTQPSVSLEEMIGKFVFSGGGADKDSGEKPVPVEAVPEPTDKPVKPVAEAKPAKPIEPEAIEPEEPIVEEVAPEAAPEGAFPSLSE
jgi:phospholipid/cholesterol/gamma-HCH transport system substrate-binding protein